MGAILKHHVISMVVMVLVAGLPVHGHQESLAQEESVQPGIFESSSPEPESKEISIETDTENDKLINQRLSEIYGNLPGLADVKIEVKAGVVQLSGSTQSKKAYEEALQLANRMKGVVSVTDSVIVQRDIGQRLTVLQEKFWSQINAFIAYIPLLIVAVVVLFFFWSLAAFMTKWKTLYRKLTPNPFLQSLLKQTVRGLILFLGFVVMLEILDATALLGTILGVAGILGIAIGFAIRDTVENYIASILLSIRQPFHPRDQIVIDNYEGLVIKLTTRDTILMTLYRNHVRIPNATVYKSNILNYTRNPNRRFTFEVGIDAVVDIVAARTLAIRTLAACPGVIADPPARCTVEKLGDSNVILKMFAWTTQNAYDFGKVKSEAIRLVKEAFDRAGYDMPEPIYRLKVQGRTGDGDWAPLQQEDTTKQTHKSPEGKSSAPSDVSKDDHIVKQISMEKEDSQEMNLLVEGEPAKTT